MRPDDGRSSKERGSSAEFPRDDTASPARDRPLLERSRDAGPLLFVAGACFLLGLFLRAMDTNGPVTALPVWSLFLALGLVASLGAGYLLTVRGDPTDDLRPEPAASRGVVPRESREEADPERSTIPNRPRPEVVSRHAFPEPLPEDMSEKVRPPAVKRRPRPNTTPAPAEVPPDRSPTDPAEQVIAEIDRMLADLRPVRPRPATR